MRIAFDLDDTLWKVIHGCSDDCEFRQQHPSERICDVHLRTTKQVPDYELIAVLKWFYQNGDYIHVWSAGGVDYAQTIVDKLGLEKMVTVIPKGSSEDMDLTFDDEAVTLGKVNIKVKRKW